MAEAGDRRSNTAMQFLKTYWFLIVFTAGAIGTVANLYFEVTFISRMVNPDTLIEYNKEQAVLSTKREIRWCLNKTVWSATIDREALLRCAD